MFPGFDPSKLDPKIIQEISELMRTLPPEQLMKMQSIMHNSMAGFDVTEEVRKFEVNLPPGFREKLAKAMYAANGVVTEPSPSSPAITATASSSGLNDVDRARLTLLEGVRDRSISPEEALRVLFP
jgi:hypothetical protein